MSSTLSLPLSFYHYFYQDFCNQHRSIEDLQTEELIQIINTSKSLSSQQKKHYLALVECTETFGIHNDMELFFAAGKCHDRLFSSSHPRNIISIENLARCFGEQIAPTLGENSLFINAQYFAENRLGFFMLVEKPRPVVYFLQKGLDDSLEYYSPVADRFEDASSLPVTGKEKLVVLNQTEFSPPETYFGTFTPQNRVQGKFYHEIQDGLLCGIHAAHAFLGFPILNTTLLTLFNLEYYTSISVNLDKRARCFELANLDWAHARAGNNANRIIYAFKCLAKEEKVPSKYGNLQMRSIEVSQDSFKFLMKKGISFDTDFIQAQASSLNRVNDELLRLEEIDPQLIDLKKDVDQKCKNDPDYWGREGILLIENNPQKSLYFKLHKMKIRFENNMHSFEELKNVFKNRDRIMVFAREIARKII